MSRDLFQNIWSDLHQAKCSRDVLQRLKTFYVSFSRSSKCPDHKAFANHAFVHFRSDSCLKEVLFGTLYAVQGCATFIDSAPMVHGLLLGAKKLKALQEQPVSGSPIPPISLDSHEKMTLDILVNSLFEVLINVNKGKDNNKNEHGSTEPATTIFTCDVQATNLSPKTLSSADMKIYLKCISHQYEIFPELKYFALDSSRITNFLLYLCEHHLFSSVRRVALLFPEACNAHFLRQLANLMLCGMNKPDKNDDGDDNGDSNNTKPQESYLSIEDFSDFLKKFDNKIPVQRRKGYYAKYFVITDATRLTPMTPAAGLESFPLPLSHDENEIKQFLKLVAIHMIESNLHLETKSELSAMIELCKYFNLSDNLTSRLIHKLRTIRIRTLVKTKKWQIAQQMASTHPLRMSLFTELVAQKLYLQANEVYHQYQFQGLVAPVTMEQMQAQEQQEKDMYLLLPVHIHPQIVVVNDATTLQRAASALIPSRLPNSPEADGNQKPFFIGVDTEWRAVVTKKGTASTGASLLQISTATQVFLFDLNTLGGRHRGDNAELIAQAGDVMQEIFSRHDIVKVGWSFSRSDIGMLKASAGGRFARSFMSSTSILDLPKMHAAHVKARNQCMSRELQVEASLSASDCCKYYFGKPLSKQEQVSNWDARPLSASQIHYASLDAHSMLAILDRISADMHYTACLTGAGKGYAVASLLQSPPAADMAASISSTGAAGVVAGADTDESSEWRAFLD